MLYSRIVLALGALMFLSLGFWLMFKPQALESFGIEARTPQGRTELRAWYGGLEIALSAFLIFGIFRPEIAPLACLVLALMSAGPLVGRVWGMLQDGSSNGQMLAIAGIELAFAVAAWVGWARGVPELS